MGDPTKHRAGRGSSTSPRRRLTMLLVGCLVVLLGGAGFVYFKLNGNLNSIDVGGMLGRNRPEKVATGAQNILVLGSDSRVGDNKKYGRDEGAARSDTAMVLHLAKGRKSGQLISIPRDTLIDRPSCVTGQKDQRRTVPAATSVMFNTAYEVGGPACAMKTVEKMSGVRLDHFVEVDFTGFKKLIDAIGGVEVNVPQDIDDDDSHLHIKKGKQTLNGEQALGLVRTRHGYKNGSDLGRIELQQLFIKSLMAQVKELGLLTSPTKLYDVADTATSAITTDSGLGSLPRLVGFGRSVSGLDSKHLEAVTLPVLPAPQDPNRVVPQQPQADEMWAAVREDRPLPDPSKEPDPSAGSGSSGGGE